MLRWVILSVAVVALTAVATVLINLVPAAKSPAALKVSPKSDSQAKVEIDGDTVYNFGTMPQRTKKQHSWTFRNVGKGDLEIWLGGTTCKCTVAKLEELKEKGGSIKLKPGEKTTIDLEWDSKETEGQFAQEAKINTNDPERPMIPLVAKGTVHPIVVVMPKDRTIALNTVSSEDPKTGSAAIYAPEQPDMKIVKISTSKPDFIVAKPKPLSEEDLKSLKVKGGYRLDVEVKPGMPLGAFRDEVVVETDNKLEPEIRLKVSGTVTGPISVLPDRLRLINVTTTRGGSGEATLLVRGGKPTKFEVAQKPEKVDVQIASAETNTLKGRYRMTVSVPPGTPSGHIEGTIILKTDNPKAAEIKVPVNIFVLGSGAG
jgi:hypothetical protein